MNKIQFYVTPFHNLTDRNKLLEQMLKKWQCSRGLREPNC